MEKTEYHIQMCDNGIVVAAPDLGMLECKEFSGTGRGKVDDEAMHKYLGHLLWSDILSFCNQACINNIKLTISIEEDK